MTLKHPLEPTSLLSEVNARALGMPNKSEIPLDFDPRLLHNAVAHWLNGPVSKHIHPGDVQDWRIRAVFDTPVDSCQLMDGSVHVPEPEGLKVDYVSIRLKDGSRRYFCPVRDEVFHRPATEVLSMMSLEEFMNFTSEQKEKPSLELFNSCVVEVTHTILENFDCSKEEAEAYAEEFANKLNAEDRLTQGYIGSNPFHWEAVKDFAQ